MHQGQGATFKCVLSFLPCPKQGLLAAAQVWLACLLGASGPFCLHLPSPYSYMLALMALCVCVPCVHVLWRNELGASVWLSRCFGLLSHPQPLKENRLTFLLSLSAKAVWNPSKGGSTGRWYSRLVPIFPSPSECFPRGPPLPLPDPDY